MRPLSKEALLISDATLKRLLSCGVAVLLCAMLLPVSAIAEEGSSPNSGESDWPESEYDRGTGAQAESWRYTEGLPDSLLLEYAEECPGASVFGAYDDLPSDKVQSARDTWTKENGTKSYTYRKNPADPDTIVKVPGSYAVGIDVSEHNNAPGGKPASSIDWQKVKADGVSFAIIRCGYGSDFASQDDKWFADNFRGAKAAGLKVGVYLYSYATKIQGNNSAAESEAAHVLRILRQNNIRPADLDLPIYLDLEDDSQEVLPRSLLGQIAKTFCGTLQRSGYKVGIYANQYWYTSVLTDPVFSKESMKAANWSRWVARYSWGDSDPGVAATDIWQFTEIGKVNGTPKKYCDVNFVLSSTLASSMFQASVESNGKWVQKSGNWYLRDPWGSNLTGWQLVGGTYYYMNSSGVMLTGWQQVGGKWYYLGSSGAMRTGWQMINGYWYYLSASGAMATGWQKVGSCWYHLKPSGAMTTDWLRQGPTWYYLDGSGAMATGWKRVGGAWYWFSESGHMATGWQKAGSCWYHLKPSGAMTTGWLRQGPTWYYLDGSGAMATGWKRVGGAWYWFSESGHMATGWLELNGNTFFLEANGAMACNTIKVIGNVTYEFDGNGVLVNRNEED